MAIGYNFLTCQKRIILFQRPLRSTSSNDEGISEMDALDSSSGGSDIFRSKENQMLNVKAEMLKVHVLVLLKAKNPNLSVN